MRRAVVLLVVVATALAVASGVVLADDKSCTGGDCVGTRDGDTITGTTSADRIAGMEGDDSIASGDGNGQVFGDEGKDTVTDSPFTGTENDTDSVFGDEGKDTINVDDGDGNDSVDCGPGRKDRVFFDEGDTVLRNCEIRNPATV
jgi:RTX calcium-binding nonapeptide repeat (4 copies)